MVQDPGEKKSAPMRQGAAMESLLAQWARERPDLDSSPMAVCGEIWRANERVGGAVAENAKRYGLDRAAFDVVMTLRRQGKGQTLTPSALASDMMLSTSAMTNRLDRLEKTGLIERIADPEDRRSMKIALTDDGFALVDKMVVTHLEVEHGLLDALSMEEREELKRLLRKVGA